MTKDVSVTLIRWGPFSESDIQKDLEKIRKREGLSSKGIRISSYLKVPKEDWKHEDDGVICRASYTPNGRTFLGKLFGLPPRGTPTLQQDFSSVQKAYESAQESYVQYNSPQKTLVDKKI